MARSPVSFWRRIVPLLSHRVLSVDRGSSWVKVLVADSTFGVLRVVHRQTVDLRAEELSNAKDVDERLQALVMDLNVEHVAFVLPQHRCIGQVVEIPDDAGSAEAKVVLEKEATRLSGLRPENLQYEFARLNPFAHYENPYWLTLCKAEEVTAFLAPVMENASVAGAPHRLSLSEVASTAQAMVVAAGAEEFPENAILVDLGANSSTVVILAEGQRAFATSLAHGSEQFVQARPVVRVVQDSASGPPGVPAGPSRASRGEENKFPFGPGIERWHGEMRKAVVEWLEDHPRAGLALSSLPVYLCGGAAARPGLVQHLNGLGTLRFRAWSAGSDKEGATQYCTAYGAALQALGRAPQPVSLLPAGWRVTGKRERWWEQVQAGIVVCLALLTALLAYGTWINSVHLVRKTELRGRTTEAIAVAGDIRRAFDVLVEEYDRIHPLLERQRRTVRVLHALSAVQRTHANNDYWYVLFADQESYLAGGTGPTVVTDLVGAAPNPDVASEASKRTFILELCTPSEGEALRGIRNQVVAGLSQDAIFERVDALPLESKREWVDPKVFITNQVFAFMMQFTPPDRFGGFEPAKDRGTDAANGRYRARNHSFFRAATE